MLSVSLVRSKNEALKKLYFKSIIKCFKRVKIDKWPDSPYSFPPIDYCVRINCEPDRLFSHRFLDSDCIHFKTFVFLAVYWPVWTSYYTTQTSKFNNFLNGASTMLNNVFNPSVPFLWLCCLIVLSHSMWSCIICRVYHIVLFFCLIYDTVTIIDIREPISYKLRFPRFLHNTATPNILTC